MLNGREKKRTPTMSLARNNDYTIPAETIRVAHLVFPNGNMFLQMRDELGIIYEDEAFEGLFSQKGQPGIAPWRLMLVTIMQYMEGLTDREAAAAVGSRIDWKYALSLELTAVGIDNSVLSEFRTRLIAGGAEQILLGLLLERLQSCGLLTARGRQRTDSTHVLAAIRVLDRLERVGETLRAALNSIALVAPDWLRSLADSQWFERYSSRIENYHLPKGEAKRLVLAGQIGDDGFHLLTSLQATSAPRWLRQIAAVQILRQVWIQQYYAPCPEQPARWRAITDVPPSSQLIHSPYDSEARYSTKHNRHWVGYKVHLTETCDEDTPHIITHVETTAATVPDYAVLETIHKGLEQQHMLPAQHLLDGGYVDAQHLVNSQATYAIQLISPVRINASWQAQAGQGFAVPDFSIDWQQQTATCPQGQTTTRWKPARNRAGEPIIHVGFDQKICFACPVRKLCTKSKTQPRELTLFPIAQHDALRDARQFQLTPLFQAQYAARSGIEATIAQALRVHDLRHARYIGLAKTRLQHILTALALNIARTVAWLDGRPRAQTRTSHFAALAA